jgi:hypothetical protein
MAWCVPDRALRVRFDLARTATTTDTLAISARS